MRVLMAWTIGFLSALIAAVVITLKLVFPWTDEVYVESLNLPPEADSLGIPIFGGLIFGIFLLLAIASFYIALRTVIKNNSKTHLSRALWQSNESGRNAAKLSFLLFTVAWMILFYSPFTMSNESTGT